MKRSTSKLLLLMTVLAMAFSIAACGSKSDDGGSAEDKKEETANGAGQSGDDEEDAANGASQSGDDEEDADTEEKSSSLYGSVEEYVNSDEMQTALNSLRESYQQEDIDINIIAEGENKMVYVFTYKTIAHTEGDGMAEALESAIAAQDATFQQTANSVKPFVGGEQVTVEIRYVDMNGAVIFSKSYVSE